jgi:hypothetical protein
MSVLVDGYFAGVNEATLKELYAEIEKARAKR